jgi:hypothetical protein
MQHPGQRSSSISARDSLYMVRERLAVEVLREPEDLSTVADGSDQDFEQADGSEHYQSKRKVVGDMHAARFFMTPWLLRQLYCDSLYVVRVVTFWGPYGVSIYLSRQQSTAR